VIVADVKDKFANVVLATPAEIEVPEFTRVPPPA
jgi:hypothetical protein